MPDFTGSTSNQRNIIGGQQPMPDPVPYTPSSGVQRTDLPPPSASQPLLPGVAPQPVASMAPEPRAIAAASTPQPLSTPGSVAAHKGGWDATGGTVVTLGPGETLSSVSRRYGVPVKELARANGIADPSQVGSGTRITIPTYAVGAASAAGGTQIAATPERKPAGDMAETTSLNGLHTVAPGQTVNSIARLYNVSPRELAAANSLGDDNSLRSGQKIRIPGRGTSQVAVLPEPARREEKPKAEDPGAKPVAADMPASRADGAAKTAQLKAPATTGSIAPSPSTAAASAAAEMAGAAAKPQPAAYAPPDDGAKLAAAEPASANGTSFRWPVRGRIIGSFGAAATGEKNDGINLAVPEGTSIKAAEAGTVIYAGNELEGYGQLVLVRHADGWVSAYAHNSDILVKRGDTVRRGQIISRAGTSGSVSSPQLHFELRKGSKPVNPLDYLQG